MRLIKTRYVRWAEPLASKFFLTVVGVLSVTLWMGLINWPMFFLLVLGWGVAFILGGQAVQGLENRGWFDWDDD
ncbi:MAG: hypothetical protein AAF661_16360 [Pseudomonadota bacterium]